MTKCYGIRNNTLHRDLRSLTEYIEKGKSNFTEIPSETTKLIEWIISKKISEPTERIGPQNSSEQMNISSCGLPTKHAFIDLFSAINIKAFTLRSNTFLSQSRVKIPNSISTKHLHISSENHLPNIKILNDSF